MAAFARAFLAHSRHRAALAFGFLLLGSLTEGVSFLLLVPILQTAGLAAEQDPVVHLPAFHFAGIDWPGAAITLLPALMLMAGLIAARALFMRYKSIYMIQLLYDFTSHWRIALFRSIGAARWSYIARTRASDFHHVLTSDIDRIEGGTLSLLLLSQVLALLAVYLAVSWLVSPAMTLFAFAVGATAFLVLYPLRRRSAALGAQVTESRKSLNHTVSEFLAGLKVAKTFGAEPRYADDFAATLAGIRAGNVAFVRLNSASSLVFQVVGVVALSGYVYVALEVLRLPVAELLVLIFLYSRLAPQFSQIQVTLQDILFSLPAFETVRSLHEACEREREQQSPEELPAPALRQAIRFEGVSFRYDPAQPKGALRDISLVLPAGQITAVIGPSGSGKSTLADMLMGFVTPDTGLITVDGVPLTEANRRRWRARVAYVPQETFLLHDTVRANIRLAAPAADDEAIWQALRTARADGFVAALPRGLDTVVGDRGVRLSGGERQRIALARALLRRPQLLILDEATSALDWETQASIAEAIEQLRGAMTIVTIAHRLSMIAFADRVVILEDGAVVETGGFRDLALDPASRLALLVAGEQSAARTSAA